MLEASNLSVAKRSDRDISDMLTIGIKTFCRPGCLDYNLEHLSDNLVYNRVPVIVSDDSNEKYKLMNRAIIDKYRDRGMHIQHLELDYDSGLSYGRNQLVDACTSDYILVLDDSRTISDRSYLHCMVAFLEETGYDLVAGRVSQREGVHAEYAKVFNSVEEIDGKMHIYSSDINETICNSYFTHAYDANIVLNVFVARTASIRASKWRDELVVGEHETFFYDFFEKGYKCAIAREVDFLQAPKALRRYPDEVTADFRERAFEIYRKYVVLHF